MIPGMVLLCKRLLSKPPQTRIVRLKGGDRFCNKLRFGILRLQVPFVLLHEEQDPEVPVHHEDIGFSVRVRPANEEGNVFSLSNITVMRNDVLEHGEEICGKITNSRFFPRGNSHRLVQIVEEHSIMCVFYPTNRIPFIVENHLVNGWLGKDGISEKSSDIPEGDDDIVGLELVYRPVRS